jgi:hypothetical protein
MKGISSERQAQILGIMKAEGRSQACAIVSRNIVGFWSDDQAGAEELPLAHYGMTDMPELTKFGDYEVHVAPVGFAVGHGVGEQKSRMRRRRYARDLWGR